MKCFFLSLKSYRLPLSLLNELMAPVNETCPDKTKKYKPKRDQAQDRDLPAAEKRGRAQKKNQHIEENRKAGRNRLRIPEPVATGNGFGPEKSDPNRSQKKGRAPDKRLINQFFQFFQRRQLMIKIPRVFCLSSRCWIR